jgi:hypothetical protein
MVTTSSTIKQKIDQEKSSLVFSEFHILQVSPRRFSLVQFLEFKLIDDNRFECAAVYLKQAQNQDWTKVLTTLKQALSKCQELGRLNQKFFNEGLSPWGEQAIAQKYKLLKNNERTNFYTAIKVDSIHEIPFVHDTGKTCDVCLFVPATDPFTWRFAREWFKSDLPSAVQSQLT